MTTTFAAIRDNAETLVEALIPSTLSDVPFRSALGELDFEAWANNTPLASFRRFAMSEVDGPDGYAMSNSSQRHVSTFLQILIAYPKDGRYGQDNARDLRDVVREDWLSIDGELGVGENNREDFVSGTVAIDRSEVAIEGDDDPDSRVVFSRLIYRVDYKEAIAS